MKMQQDYTDDPKTAEEIRAFVREYEKYCQILGRKNRERGMVSLELARTGQLHLPGRVVSMEGKRLLT
jgi:hypothetical protein